MALDRAPRIEAIFLFAVLSVFPAFSQAMRCDSRSRWLISFKRLLMMEAKPTLSRFRVLSALLRLVAIQGE